MDDDLISPTLMERGFGGGVGGLLEEARCFTDGEVCERGIPELHCFVGVDLPESEESEPEEPLLLLCRFNLPSFNPNFFNFCLADAKDRNVSKFLGGTAGF